MAVSNKKKTLFNAKVKEFKEKIEENKLKIKDLKIKAKDNEKLAPYYKIALATETLNMVQTYCQISDLSMEILNIKNESYLNNARKEIYNVFIPLEEVVGSAIDSSLNENQDVLKTIRLINPAHKLTLVQKLNSNILGVIDRFGSNSKWKWSFVEFHSRAAAITKNLIDFRSLQKNRDPRSKFYMERQALLRLCKDSLKEASEQNRNKYELSTKVPGDMIKAINLLASLRMIYSQFGDKEELGKLKSAIDFMRQKLEKDEKAKEAKKK